MKLYLASFMEPENFGSGRLIGVCDGNKPFNIQVDWKYPQFIPKKEYLQKYIENKNSNYKEARLEFIQSYDKQLRQICEEIEQDAEKQKIIVQELLPFQEGDTFCSWERKERTHYRNVLGGWLEYLGYEVNYA